MNLREFTDQQLQAELARRKKAMFKVQTVHLLLADDAGEDWMDALSDMRDGTGAIVEWCVSADDNDPYPISREDAIDMFENQELPAP